MTSRLLTVPELNLRASKQTGKVDTKAHRAVKFRADEFSDNLENEEENLSGTPHDESSELSVCDPTYQVSMHQFSSEMYVLVKIQSSNVEWYCISNQNDFYLNVISRSYIHTNKMTKCVRFFLYFYTNFLSTVLYLKILWWSTAPQIARIFIEILIKINKIILNY